MIITKEQFQAMKLAPNSAYNLIKPEFLFHSNKLEGSTFTEEEIERLIEDGIVEGSHTFDDVIETRNSIDVFDYVVETLDMPLTAGYLIDLNTKLLRNTTNDQNGFVGHFKVLANRIRNSSVQVALPSEVPDAIDSLLDHWNNSARDFNAIAEFHVRFEHIHPFQEGNGRIGRFLMFKQCIENKVDLIVIDEKYNNPYKAWLEVAQTQGDSRFFKQTLHECQDYFSEKMRTKGIERLLPTDDEIQYAQSLAKQLKHERLSVKELSAYAKHEANVRNHNRPENTTIHRKNRSL